MYKKLCIAASVLLCVSCSIQPADHPIETSSGEHLENASLKVSTVSNEKIAIEQKSAYIIALLQRSDFAALASQVHPELGLLLSAGPQLDQTVFPQQTLYRAELAGFLSDPTPRIWGTDKFSSPIRATGKTFWENYIYTKAITPEATHAYDDVGITDMTEELINDQIQKKFPGAHFVEYKVESGENRMESKTWSLRLIFSSYKGQWYLVGIVRDEKVS